jgi:hypothetical protein
VGRVRLRSDCGLHAARQRNPPAPPLPTATPLAALVVDTLLAPGKSCFNSSATGHVEHSFTYDPHAADEWRFEHGVVPLSPLPVTNNEK